MIDLVKRGKRSSGKIRCRPLGDWDASCLDGGGKEGGRFPSPHFLSFGVEVGHMGEQTIVPGKLEK